MAILASLLTAPLGTVAALRDIDRLLDEVHTGDVSGGPAAAIALGEVDRVISRLQAVRLSLLAEADRSEIAASAGLTGTSAWLAVSTRQDGGQAARDVRLAAALDNGLPATREALAAGELSTEHAQVIATATSQLPAGLSLHERTVIESDLVRRAKLVDPASLRKEGRRILSATKRSQAEVEAHEDQVLRTEEDSALARSRLTWHHNGDGTTTGHFTLPSLAASILAKTVQQIASPRRFALRAAKAATAAGASACGGRGGHLGCLPWGRRRLGAPLRQGLRRAPRAPADRCAVRQGRGHRRGDHRSRAAQGRGGGRHLDTGQDLSAGEVRRLACNAGIVPAVLGSRSVPLDLGRQERFFTEAQRTALATTYDTCAADGCDRPYAWSELHHEDPWSQGGRSDLAKAVPLCGHHHRRAHDPRYSHRIATEVRGKKCVAFALRT